MGLGWSPIVHVGAVLLALAVPVLAVADMRPVEGPAIPDDRALLRDPDAPPRTLAQLMFDPDAGALSRRVYTLVAPRLVGSHDVVWQPSALATASGALSGAGRLVWRRAGTPAYAQAAVVAAFEGAFVDGRAEGFGRFWHRDGFLYEGDWRLGRMEGQGRLQLPGGRHYEGAFQAGLRHGRGRFVDETGSVFEAVFERDVLSGAVTVTPFDGPAYRAEFRAGREVTGSREILPGRSGPSALHLVQATRLPDARLGLALDPSPPPNWFGPFDPSYDSRSDGAIMQVYRADRAVRDAWFSTDRIPVRRGGEMEDMLGPETHVDPGFTISFENVGGRPLQIVGGRVAVRQSTSFLRPVLDVFVPQDCGQPVIADFTLTNYGWSQPRGAHLTVDFLDWSGHVAATVDGPVSQGWPVALVDLSPALRAQGVDVTYIENSGQLRCQSSSAQGCLSELAGSGLYGALAGTLSLGGSAVHIPYQARLDFGWTEANGAARRESLTFASSLKVGQLPFQPECGEGGGIEENFPYPFRLSLDRTDYSVPFGLNATVLPGQVSRWAFQMQADKASFHDFQIVLSLADGREIASRPVSLEYLRPANPYANY